MKVVIGPYRSWIGPYQIADALCFWVPKKLREGEIFARKPDWVHDFGEWLATDRNGEDSWLYKVCNWIEARKQRQIYVRIDKYDSWSADATLALIALPLLKQLRANNHGAAIVSDEDIPEGLGLRTTESQRASYSDDYDPDHFYAKRWDWVLGEMIWAFEQKVDDDADSKFFHKKNPNLKTKDVEESVNNFEIDMEGLRAWQERKNRGFQLFGKYYENLWD